MHAKAKKKQYNDGVKQKKLARAFNDLLSDMPAGVIYCPKNASKFTSMDKSEGIATVEIVDRNSLNHRSAMEARESSLPESQIQIGDFIVDIDEISKESLILIRRFLPQNDYKKLKNRKCARIIRKQKKEKA